MSLLDDIGKMIFPYTGKYESIVLQAHEKNYSYLAIGVGLLLFGILAFYIVLKLFGVA